MISSNWKLLPIFLHTYNSAKLSKKHTEMACVLDKNWLKYELGRWNNSNNCITVSSNVFSINWFFKIFPPQIVR